MRNTGRVSEGMFASYVHLSPSAGYEDSVGQMTSFHIWPLNQTLLSRCQLLDTESTSHAVVFQPQTKNHAAPGSRLPQGKRRLQLAGQIYLAWEQAGHFSTIRTSSVDSGTERAHRSPFIFLFPFSTSPKHLFNVNSLQSNCYLCKYVWKVKM